MSTLNVGAMNGLSMASFEELKAFCIIVETGSITEAAKTLHVAKSAVSRRLKELEDRLGAQLLFRTTRSVSLTDTGEHFYIQARQILNDLQDAEQSVIESSKGPSGLLRLSAPTSFGRCHLFPILLDFLEAHPGIRFDFVFTDVRVDVVGERFDIALRIGELPDSSLRVRRLAEIKIVLVCSPEYLNQPGRIKPKVASDMADHEVLIYSNTQTEGVFRFKSESGENGSVKIKGQNQTNQGEFMEAAARRGIGIAKLPRFIAAAGLESGELIQILPQYDWGNTALYAVYPPSRHLSSRVRECIDYLAKFLNQRTF